MDSRPITGGPPTVPSRTLPPPPAPRTSVNKIPSSTFPPNSPVRHSKSKSVTLDAPPPIPIHEFAGGSTEPPEDIIASPLDQRRYKSITLPNGVKAMLISTYDVEPYPDEMDATRTPCQIPEVAEFNKTYLGYDNPAARVKCSCPCDGRKPCCGSNPAEELSEGKLKALEETRLTCCARFQRARPKKERASKASKRLPQQDIEGYRAALFKELEERELHLKRRRSSRSRSLNFAASQVSQKPMKNSLKRSKSSSEKDKTKVESEKPPEEASNIPSGVASEEALEIRRKSVPRHYPHPPKYYEGMHAMRNFPAGAGGGNTSNTPRGRNTRPHMSSELNFDLDGTVYLVIGSGYFDDPIDQPGLAHFCEHAVFLGSQKFPEPNQLFKLVLPYDGYVNAYTSGMTTTFTASSSFRLFPLSVEILGDMVGFPLFPNALVRAEIEALDSEYSLRQDDTPKYFQLIGSLAKKGHVMRKMDSGNINTLTVPNFYRKLVEWRKIYYNPKRMTLALEAPFPLDFLEHLVVESFGRMPEGVSIPIRRNLLLSSPFEMGRFHQIYHVPSVYHSEFMAIHWALESKAWKNLQVKPLEYLGAIISHRAEGGLFDYLTSQGLATNVDAGCWESDVTRNHYTTVFAVSVDMTEKGFKKQDVILQAVFGYIQMLIKAGPQKTFYQELQKQQLESFHFRAAESTLSIAENVSRWLQYIPPKWCLISPSLTCKFDQDLIQQYTKSLTIDSANIIIFSKNYRGVEYKSMEEFYNTPYASINFPEELEEKVRRSAVELSAKFSVPPPNPLLLETTCNRAREKDLLRKGNLLKIKGKLTVSYISRKVRLVRGLLPQARYSLWIGSPIASYVGAQEGSSTKILMWSLYFNELFESKFYHISNADVQLETEIAQEEIHVVLAGPHTMLPTIMRDTIELFNNFENVIDPVGFDVVKSSFIESLDNTILDNRFLAWDLFYFLWTNNHDLIFDHKRNAERLSFSDFVEFIKDFKKQMYIQVHLYGYVTKFQAEQIVRAVQKIQYEPVQVRQYLSLRCLKLPLGERIIKVHSQNPSIHTSVVINSYQFGKLSEEEEDVVNFFAKTMSDAAFYKLRTEQQLGYIIIIYSEMTFGVSSIVVELVTQPKNFSTDYCNLRIDQFLEEFYQENLATQEAYDEFSLGKPKVDLSFAQVQQLFSTFLLPNQANYRKLSIQVVGSLQEDSQNMTGKNAEKAPTLQSTTTAPAAAKNAKGKKSEVKDVTATDPVSKKSMKAPTDSKALTDHMRTAKKSLQVRSGRYHTKTKSPGGKGAKDKEPRISVKIIEDVAKFKSSLARH